MAQTSQRVGADLMSLQSPIAALSRESVSRRRPRPSRATETEREDAVAVLRRLRALSRISGRLPAIRDEDLLLREVVLGLSRYFDYSCEVRIFVTDADGESTCGFCASSSGQVEPIECAGIDALAPMHRDLFLVPQRLQSNHPGRGTILSAPLIEGTSLLGLLLVECDPDRELAAHELETLAGVAAQSSMTLVHLRTSGRVIEHRMMERDLELARRIQHSFLPQLPEELASFRIAARYQPAFAVGGDFYDVLSPGEGQVLATIGDVSGKGVSGALLMARVTAELRRISSVDYNPARILGQLDSALASQIADDTFVTAACALFDSRTRSVRVANAGHVQPIVRKASGLVKSFGTPSGPPLAMVRGQSWTDEVLPMEPGDILLLMTDGILDALHTEADPLGLVALEALVRRMPPDIFDITERILGEVQGRNAALVDDITLLAIEMVE